MRRLHIASFSGRSGVSKYSLDFFENVLAERGYEKLDLASSDRDIAAWLAPDDVAHIEVGVNERAAIDLLYRLVAGAHPKIDVTLHDPPFVRWPHFEFDNRALNTLSKLVHLYLGNFGTGGSALRGIRRLFALTHRGRDVVRKRYSLENVFYLPHVVPTRELRAPTQSNSNLVFFGFIAKNKGLDYALALHEALLIDFPDSVFFVIGDTADATSARYLESLRRRYTRNVTYCGFVEDKALASQFDQAAFALLPFEAYRSVVPASGSVLTAMKMGKVVLTTDVNAVSELVRDGQTGYLLTRELAKDVAKLRLVISSPAKTKAVAHAALEYIRSHHSPSAVGKCFDRAGA